MSSLVTLVQPALEFFFDLNLSGGGPPGAKAGAAQLYPDAHELDGLGESLRRRQASSAFEVVAAKAIHAGEVDPQREGSKRSAHVISGRNVLPRIRATLAASRRYSNHWTAFAHPPHTEIPTP